jgi:hypothetical protein
MASARWRRSNCKVTGGLSFGGRPAADSRIVRSAGRPFPVVRCLNYLRIEASYSTTLVASPRDRSTSGVGTRLAGRRTGHARKRRGV